MQVPMQAMESQNECDTQHSVNAPESETRPLKNSKENSENSQDVEYTQSSQNSNVPENDSEQSSDRATEFTQPGTFIDKILDILELIFDWYKIVIPSILLVLVLLQVLTYSIGNFIGFLTSSLLLNLIVFISGIVTTLLAIYLGGAYFDFKNKNAEHSSSAAKEFYQKFYEENSTEFHEYHHPALELSSSNSSLEGKKVDLSFARKNLKNSSSFKVQNTKVANSDQNPVQNSVQYHENQIQIKNVPLQNSSNITTLQNLNLTHTQSLKNPQKPEILPKFKKSMSTQPTAPTSINFASQPFSARARGIPMVNLSSTSRSIPKTLNCNHSNSLKEDILPHITKSRDDPKSVWLTHLMKHLWKEWLDSDRFYNGIRRKILEEIRELLAKQTKFMGKDISVTDIVKSIDIHHIELGNVTPELTDFAHCYNDDNRTCFEFDVSYDNKNKEKDSMYVEIDCDFVRGRQREMRFRIKLNLLCGRIKVCLERDPYSFWWFAFITDPQIDLQIIQLPNNDNNNALVKWFRDEFLVSRVKAVIRKHHKLPNHKVRTRPLIPDLSVNSITDCGLPGLMGLLGNEIPEYNIVELEVLEYSRFPLEFDRSSPEANCFIRYTIEMITIEDGIKRNSDGFEVIDEDDFEDCVVESGRSRRDDWESKNPEIVMEFDENDEFQENSNYPKIDVDNKSDNTIRSDNRTDNRSENRSISADNSPIKLDTTSKGSNESLDTEASPTRSKLGRIKKAAFDHGLGLRRRNTAKVKSDSPRSENPKPDLTETKSLNSDSNTGVEAFQLNLDDQGENGYKNSFGQTVCRIQDNEDENVSPRQKTYKSDFIIPDIKSNLGSCNKWRQKHVINFDPKKSGQFLRISFESMNQKTNFLNQLGNVEIPIENIIALIKTVRSRTATRRFRVSKNKQAKDKIPKEFQTWRKLNCTNQRRFNEEFCYGDICIKFRVTSQKENEEETRLKQEELENSGLINGFQTKISNRINRNTTRNTRHIGNQPYAHHHHDTIGTVESAIHQTMSLGDVTLKHYFVPIGLKPFEVAKYICKVCKKRMFNPKSGQQRKCKYCDLMIHERCQVALESQEFEFCEVQQNRLANERTVVGNDEIDGVRDVVGEAIDELAGEEIFGDGSSLMREDDTITETNHQPDHDSINSLPSSISVNLSSTKSSHSISHTGRQTKTDRQANMAKYLKSEFERRSLQSNRDKYAFIRNKIENVIDDKRVEPSEKEDDLTILQLFSMHYNVDHN